MKIIKKNGFSLAISLVAVILALTFVLVGCGEAGINGADGVDGADGTNGIDGKDGVDGSDGKDGTDGLDGADGKDGANGAKWLYGSANVETLTDGEIGDFYIDTDDRVLYQKDENGEWIAVMENFGAVGAQGESGDAGAQGDQGNVGSDGLGYYTHVVYAEDEQGTGMSETYSFEHKYMGIATTNSPELPAAVAFTTWIKLSDAHGQMSESGHTYIAYASDAEGSDFSFTHQNGLDYMAILVSELDADELTAYDFAGNWLKFVSRIITVTLECGDAFEDMDATLIKDGGCVKVDDNGYIRATDLGTALVQTSENDIAIVTVVPAVVDIILFTGQSNGHGQGLEPYDVNIEEGQAYEFRYDDKISPHLHTLECATGERMSNGSECGATDLINAPKSTVVARFCENYINATGRKVVAVHAASGGKKISYFTTNGYVYDKGIKVKLNACYEYLEADGRFEIGHKYYVMIQGESDTKGSGEITGYDFNQDGSVNKTYKDTTVTSTSAEDYKTRYMEFHNNMKNIFGMELGITVYTSRNSQADYEKVDVINGAKYDIANENDDIILCDIQSPTFNVTSPYYRENSSYINEDDVHWSTKGLLAVADEACKNFVNFLGYGDESLKGVDPLEYITSGKP